MTDLIFGLNKKKVWRKNKCLKGEMVRGGDIQEKKGQEEATGGKNMQGKNESKEIHRKGFETGKSSVLLLL